MLRVKEPSNGKPNSQTHILREVGEGKLVEGNLFVQ